MYWPFDILLCILVYISECTYFFLIRMNTDVIDNMNMIIISIRRSTSVNISICVSISISMCIMPVRISL